MIALSRNPNVKHGTAATKPNFINCDFVGGSVARLADTANRVGARRRHQALSSASVTTPSWFRSASAAMALPERFVSFSKRLPTAAAMVYSIM